MSIKTKYRHIIDDFKLQKKKLHSELEKIEVNSDLNSIPIVWDHAHGESVYDDCGNRWIDFTSGIFVANMGHAHPEIGKALADNFQKGKVFSYNYASKIRLDYDEALLNAAPKHFGKIAHFTSGTEPVFSAYKVMKAHGSKTGRKYIVTFRGNYHGRGLVNDFICGGEEKSSWAGVRDENVIFLDFPYEENISFDASLLPPANEIIGFFMETFQGWGACFYPEGFLNALRDYIEQNNILLCFDEMQSGFYRMGKLFGYQTYKTELKPDFICLGKGISSSLSYSALLMTYEMGEVAETLHLQGTHSGNLLNLIAAHKNLELLEREESQVLIKENMAVFEEYCQRFKTIEKVKKVNCRGMIAGIIFENKDIADNVVKKSIEQGILPVCTNRESIKLGPPLVIQTEALLEGLDVLLAVLKG